MTPASMSGLKRAGQGPCYGSKYPCAPITLTISPWVLKPCHSYIVAIHQTGKTDSEGQARTCHLGLGFRVWGQISKPVSLVLGSKNGQGLSSAAVARAWGKKQPGPYLCLTTEGPFLSNYTRWRLGPWAMTKVLCPIKAERLMNRILHRESVLQCADWRK